MSGDTFPCWRLGGTAGLAAGFVDGSGNVGLCRQGLGVRCPCLDSHGEEVGTGHGDWVMSRSGVNSRQAEKWECKQQEENVGSAHR